MNAEKQQSWDPVLRLIPSAVYLILVGLCIYLAFDFDGKTDGLFWLILLLMTYPWSIVTLFFSWALMHGAGLEIFSMLYFLCGLLNSYLIYLIFRPRY